MTIEDRNDLHPPDESAPRPADRPAAEPDDPTLDVEATIAVRPTGDRDPAGEPGRGTPVRPGDASFRLPPGSDFGPYEIVRPLGRGGMGEVYEAIHSVSRHRLALKILPGEHAWSEERRKRFHREGLTAASVNHPHSLYVFGTAEIDRTPVIAMELAAGGTLLDRIDREGPLPVKAAVDAVLQLTEGLEAAAAAGVLHRDVKPANCFVDQSGAVKVGDYGLSLPVEAEEFTQLTQDGSSPMTPAFASPEQMLGQTLDVRADIYSLGATLYNLLTGRTPYVATNLVAMIASVMGSSPKSPSELRADIPPGLSQVILRCLQKNREDRYPDYAALRRALLPFSSEEPEEAGLRARIAAGFVDLLSSLALSAVLAPITVTHAVAVAVIEPCIWMGLTGFLEGFWGGTPGKLLCRLRTVARAGGRAGPIRGLARALIFGLIPTVVSVFSETLWAIDKGNGAVWWEVAIWPIVLGALFLPAIRKRSGIPFHDRISGTRVVLDRRTEPAAVPVRHAPPPSLADLRASWRLGPFRIACNPATAEPGNIVEGYDDTLRRSVWIRFTASTEPWLPESRRLLQRASRLRWVDGERGGTIGWDAFESVPGQSLSGILTDDGVPWDPAGRWLDDLASELTAMQAAGDGFPRLAPDRVWITTSQRAILLDFAPPGTAGEGMSTRSAPADEASSTPEEFLRDITTRCAGQVPGLGGKPRTRPFPSPRRRAPWPLAVNQKLAGLLSPKSPSGAPTLLDRISVDLHHLRSHRGTVTRRQRAWQVALVVGPIVAMIPILNSAPRRETSAAPNRPGYEFGLQQSRITTCVRSLARPQPAPGDTSAIRYRKAAGIHLRHLLHAPADSVPRILSLPIWVGRQRTVLDSLRGEPAPNAAEVEFAQAEFARRAPARPETRQETRVLLGPLPVWVGRHRTVVDSLRREPDPNAAEVESARAEPARSATARSETRQEKRMLLGEILGVGLFFSLIAGLLSLVTGGGPLLRTLGIAVVRSDGRPAAKWAILIRSIVTWAPFPTGLILLALLRNRPTGVLGLIVPAALLAGGAVYAVLHPERSLQDRCARTWLVPR